MREASCSCGAVRAFCEGEPVRVSVCHCLDCQRRTGSAFAAQARFPSARVSITGERNTWRRIADSGSASTFAFCPICSATVAFHNEDQPEWTAVPLGAFADPDFPHPTVSVYEERKHPWTAVLGEGVEHFE